MNECPRCSRCYPDSVTECEADGDLLSRAFDGPPLIDGKYELRRALGRGGMGVVYLAHHRGLRRDVALKVIKRTRQSTEFLARFHAEATALGRLRHPHIVNVTDFGVDPRDGGMPYLAMEYLTGVTLAQALRTGPMAVSDALPILEAIASAIDFAHEHDVLHRDIKPENVFLSDNDGGRPVVKVLDFGVAQIGRRLNTPSVEGFADRTRTGGDSAPGSPETASADDEPTRAGSHVDATTTRTVSMVLTTPGEILGTLPYQAPELLAGDTASRASDVYAFGVLAFQTVVGERPYKTVNLESAIYSNPPVAHTINKSLAPQISRILAWPLSRYASDRPRSARVFVDELRRVYFQSLVESWKRTELPRRRRLAAAAALILCGIAWLADRSGWGETVERRLVDARFRYAPGRMPDPRMLVVLVDDTSLLANPTLLGERADEFAERFEQIFEAGAKGVAVDFLLPQRWSASQRFSRLVLTHADRLALAATSGPDGQVVGPECIAGLTAAALGPQRASALFGFVDMEPDGDGVIRRARLTFQDTSGAQRDSFAVRSIRAALGDGAITEALRRQQADPGERFLIDASVDRLRLSTLSWSRVPDELAKDPAIFRDRLVLVGGSFVGSSDLHRLSGQGVPMEGVLVQALIMDTILEALPIREIGIAMWLPLVFVAAWVAMEGSAPTQRFPMPTSTIAVAGAWVIAAVTLFVVAGWTVPILVPLAIIVVAGVTARFIRPLLRPFPYPDPVLI